MDPVSSKYSNSSGIWSSNLTKPLHTMTKPRIRSVSISEYDVPSRDTCGMGSTTTLQNGGIRSRLQSLPVGDGLKSGSKHSLDMIEDAFTGCHSPKSQLLSASNGFSRSNAIFSSGQMLSTDLKPNTQKPTTSVGWLEVSINSTLPASPVGISKNVFDLSHLNTELPDWKPVFKKQASLSKTSATTGSSLMKRLLPEMSSTNMYSRKIFIGGLPPDIDQNEIRNSFEHYGPLTVDWPHKVHSKSNVPPKGYAFLLFKDETSVHQLLTNCFSEGEKLFTYVKYLTSGTITRKKVQIRPWRVSDSFYMADSEMPGDSRKAIFVGGVPRPLKACELAEIMSEKFGPVTFIAIDCDSDLKYPKGAACVIFATNTSYIAAVSSRFMQLVFGSIEKKIELKPYILDDQLCDECNGIQSNGQPAPFFCGSVTCLRYYCEHCWATFHSLPGRHNHRPMFKDVFDREKFC